MDHPSPMEPKVSIPCDVNIDDLELEAQGYTREMPRQFGTLSLMSVCYALLATWNGFGSAFGTGFYEASSAGSIWTLFIAAFMTLIVALGMAELASAYPVAGAQSYWSYVVATPEWAPFSSYVSASISTFGWWLALASISNFIAAMIVGCAALYWEDYVIQRWHIYIIYVFITWMAIGMNIFGSRILPLWNKLIMYFSLVLLVASIITLLACASPNYQSAELVFTDSANSTGWSNDGFAFLLAMCNALYGFLGIDCGAHLCEEIPNPTANVPKIILYPVLIGLVTTLPFAISLSFVITDIEAVLTTRTGLPLIEAYYQATNSKAGTVVLITGFAICLFGAACANVTTSSRQMWSASRNNCFPLSRLWKQVHPRYEMPMNATCASGIFVTLYGLIFLGSSAAFSSMVGACIVFMGTSYIIPQGILAWRGRDKVLPSRHMNLGKFGLPINIISCVWTIFVDILFCFPTAYPVTAANMNWISVVIAGLSGFIFIAWYTSQRHVFEGPSLNIDLLNEARKNILQGYPVIHDSETDKTLHQGEHEISAEDSPRKVTVKED